MRLATDLQQLALLGVLTSSAHWLVARSEIARPLWSRARGWLGKLLACPACSGWWLGLAVHAGGLHAVEVSNAGTGAVAVGFLLHGLLGTWLTPVAEAVLLWGLATSAIDAEQPTEADAMGPAPEAPRPSDTA